MLSIYRVSIPGRDRPLQRAEEGDRNLADLEAVRVNARVRKSRKFPGCGLRIWIRTAESACLATKDIRGG